MRWLCGRKSCKTNSPSPKRARPPKSPVRKHVGYTKILAMPVFLNTKTKKWSAGKNVVKYVVNKKHPNQSGYYTNAEFKVLVSTPSWS